MRKRGKFLNIILIAVVVLVVLFVIASIVIINHYMKQYFNCLLYTSDAADA